MSQVVYILDQVRAMEREMLMRIESAVRVLHFLPAEPLLDIEAPCTAFPGSGLPSQPIQRLSGSRCTCISCAHRPDEAVCHAAASSRLADLALGIGLPLFECN